MMMNNQEIIDNAPLPDWTHHNDDIDSDVACFYSYIKQVEGANGQEFYKLGFDGERKVWKQCNGIYNTTRAREDVNRIVELENALDKLIGRAQQVDSWESFPDGWLDEAFEALKDKP
jgi:hypothetical protein